MIKTLSFLLLLQGASAMNIKIEDWECREEPITVNFTRICTEDNVCTTGKQSNIEGIMSYYGMYDQYGLNDESIVYLNLNMSLFAIEYDSESNSTLYDMVNKPIYNSTLYDMVEFSLCHETISSANDNNNGCPQSGDYQFQSSITVPPPSNSFTSWMYTGYTGIGELAIYQDQSYGSTILGHCTLKISTEVEDTDSTILNNTPSGKTTTIAILSTVTVMLLLGTAALHSACKRLQKEKGQLNKVGKNAPLKEKISGAFQRMQEETFNEARRSWNLGSGSAQGPALKEGLITDV